MRATRLSVTNYNTTLSSDCLETGTGSSNSLLSAKQSAIQMRTKFARVESMSLLTCHAIGRRVRAVGYSTRKINGR